MSSNPSSATNKLGKPLTLNGPLLFLTIELGDYSRSINLKLCCTNITSTKC